jgi:uncharacterized protein YjbI with pentapeptide repeats
MTLRDWLPIVGALLIPVVIAAGTWGITWQQGKIEDQRADVERELAKQRAQDEALQAYLNQMSQLMLDRKLLETEQSDPVHTLAQARTVTILRRLNSDRNRDILQFLREAYQGDEIDTLHNSNLSEANLKGANLDSFDLQRTDLSGANLRDAYLAFSDLSKAKLNGANLRGADLHGDTNLRHADLSGANLGGADLHGDTNLRHADLSGANLRSADLHGDTDLSNTNLSEANLSGTDLIGANLKGANLKGANLKGANLKGANLKGAVLSGAKGTDEHLGEAKSLEGATMPDGQTLKSDDNPDGPTLKEWLKSKRREEDGENGSQS